MNPNEAVQALKENLRHQHYARLQWENKFGPILPQADSEAIQQTLSSTNRGSEATRMRSIKPEDLSDDEEDDYDTNDPNLYSGYSARFTGFYLPTEHKKTLVTSQQEDMKQKEINLENKDNFRKKHWLKTYFEENAKMQNLFKSAYSQGGGSGGAPPAQKK